MWPARRRTANSRRKIKSGGSRFFGGQGAGTGLFFKSTYHLFCLRKLGEQQKIQWQPKTHQKPSHVRGGRKWMHASKVIIFFQRMFGVSAFVVTAMFLSPWKWMGCKMFFFFSLPFLVHFDLFSGLTILLVSGRVFYHAVNMTNLQGVY